MSERFEVLEETHEDGAYTYFSTKERRDWFKKTYGKTLNQWADEVFESDNILIKRHLTEVEEPKLSPNEGYFLQYNEEGSGSFTIQRVRYNNPRCLSAQVGDLSDKVIIINWYPKDIIEESLDGEITDEEYEELINEYRASFVPDTASEMFWDWVPDALKRVRAELTEIEYRKPRGME